MRHRSLLFTTALAAVWSAGCNRTSPGEVQDGMTADWTGSDTGRMSAPARAEWCDSLGVLEISRHSWRPSASALFSRLQRASLRAEWNIAEGCTFGNTANFTRLLGIAQGSSVESAELLRVGIEAEVLPAEQASELLLRASRASRLILGLLKPRRRFP